MKTSFKLFYYYFVINDFWNNIAFQIDENIIFYFLFYFIFNNHTGY